LSVGTKLAVFSAGASARAERDKVQTLPGLFVAVMPVKAVEVVVGVTVKGVKAWTAVAAKRLPRNTLRILFIILLAASQEYI
jgi:hypothetical protein